MPYQAPTDGAPDPRGPAWLSDLEKAHGDLREAARMLETAAQPPVDLRPAAQAMERSFWALYVAFDGRGNPLEALRRAIGELDASLGLFSIASRQDPSTGFAVEHLQAARNHMVAADQGLAGYHPPPRPAPRLLRASTDSPSLHDLAREPIVPTVWVPEPAEPAPAQPETKPAPKTFDQLEVAVQALRARTAGAGAKTEVPALPPVATAKDDEELPGFARDIPPAVTPDAFVQERVRTFFEDIAMLGTQRAPLVGDDWRSTSFLERRMLACMDAIVSMGSAAIRYLEPLVLDSPVKDPARLFALTMVLGCVEGRDSIASAERVFLTLESTDDGFAAAFGDALKLVPHPQVPVILRSFLGDSSPRRRAMAINVLGYRSLASHDELARASMDEPEVAAAALPYLAVMGHPTTKQAIDRCLGIDQDALRTACWRAMAFSDHPHAAAVLAEVAGPRGDRAAMSAAIMADARDGARLVELTQQRPFPALVDAVGWAGSIAAVPVLIELLATNDEAMKVSAAGALERITGAGLTEEAEIEGEELLPPEPPELELGERKPLRVLLSDPRDVSEEGSKETIERPTTDADRWRAFWREQEQEGKLEPSARYRRGCPYTPLVSLNELDQGRNTFEERGLLRDELIIRTSGYTRMDPHDFVAVQEAALQAWAPIAATSSNVPGTWDRPQRRG